MKRELFGKHAEAYTVSNNQASAGEGDEGDEGGEDDEEFFQFSKLCFC